jgi:hypothetical protein
MSLNNALKVGDLVYVKSEKNNVLSPLIPTSAGGIGIIVNIKPTRIFPNERKAELYGIFIKGKIQDLLCESINKIRLDI